MAAPSGAQVPLGQLAELVIRSGPPWNQDGGSPPQRLGLRRSERHRRWQLGGQGAGRRWPRRVDLPPGYSIFWSGQYEYMQRAKARLLVIVPITLFLIFVILYFHTKSLIKTTIVLSAVPFALVGSIWLMDWLGYNWSVAVWVGVIALAGLAAETGVVMLLYLDIAYESWKSRGRMTIVLRSA